MGEAVKGSWKMRDIIGKEKAEEIMRAVKRMKHNKKESK